MDNNEICAELERVRADFHELLEHASVSELRQPSDGTKWTNEQLLFHMLFGYLLVRNLRFLVHGLSRLPDAASRTFPAERLSVPRRHTAGDQSLRVEGAGPEGGRPHPRVLRAAPHDPEPLKRRGPAARGAGSSQIRSGG